MDISDKELFEQALSDNDPVAPSDPVEVSADDGQPRDEHGRFAPKAEEPVSITVVGDNGVDPPAIKVIPAQEEAHVPSWRLREISEARDAERTRAQRLERELEHLRVQIEANKPKPEPANIFEDPEGYINGVQQTLDQRLTAQRFEFSEMTARDKHGDQKVDEALQWVEANVQKGTPEAYRIERARHPYAEMIRVMDERKTLSEIGTDPNAYVQKKLDEALNDPAFLAKAIERVRAQGGQGVQQPATLIDIPPSIGRAPSAGSSRQAALPMNDAEMYRDAIS